MRRRWAGLVAVVATVALAACSSDEGNAPSASSDSSASTTATTTTATTTAADACAAADTLRGSLGALRDVQIVQDGIGAAESAWATVQEDWAAFADAARGQYADQVDGVQAAADDVTSALDRARTDTSAATLSDAATSVGAYLQQADALVEEVGSAC
jgi:hypothetical protein